MSIFILGGSRAGKSNLACAVASQFSLQHTGASKWVRSSLIASSGASRSQYIDKITGCWLARLKENRAAGQR